ncbi:MAG: DNA repair protein RadC [Cellvibrionaceae bacterium]|jgi:DNA repair protein RadC
MAITDWHLAERPREKLIQQGAQALSDAELLAIFLRTGCAGKSAVDLARDLLQQFQGLRPLLDADQNQFCRAKGLGTAKFAQLQAVLEMSRRHLLETIRREQIFNSTRAVKDYLTAQLRHQQREVFSAIFLDNQHRLLCYEALFYGSINSAQVHPREVVKRALFHNAAALILAHNHPSGVAEPSDSDRHITELLERALSVVDVRVLDHVVVGEGPAVSFAERGYLSAP